MRTSPETLPVPAALHPGLVDPAYRARRDAIAASSALHVPGQPVPTLDYTEEEERTWRAVWNALLPLHREHGASCLVERGDELGLFDGPIPQLEDLNSGALAASGFRFEPVEGLVPARRFFEALGQRTFLSTRFLRHGAEPLYTPSPISSTRSSATPRRSPSPGSPTSPRPSVGPPPRPSTPGSSRSTGCSG